jgi:transcriptional regulator with PAS, ATPase and Fis domain
MTALVEVDEVTGHGPRVVEDEALAVRCAATTCLITAGLAADVEAVARRIHAAGLRAAFPFVCVSADALPTDATRISGACASLIDAGRGGSLLVANVEAMPTVVQESLVETLAQLQSASDPLDAVRLIAGTTVILHDCVVAGTFSERLFYRLNIIHIVLPGCFAAHHTLDAGTPTSAESQAAFVPDVHISEVRSE